MSKIIYSKKGIVGYGEQKGALEYFANVSEEFINSVDTNLFDVEIYEKEYIIDENNPAREDTIYCGGYISCAGIFCLHVDHTELDIIVKNYNEDVRNVEKILKLNSFSQDDSCYNLLNVFCFLGIYDSLERFLVDLVTLCLYRNEKLVNECIKSNKFLGHKIKGDKPEEKKLAIYMKIRALKIEDDYLKKIFTLFSPEAADIPCPMIPYQEIRNDLIHRNGYYKQCIYKAHKISVGNIEKMKSEFNIYVKSLQEVLSPIIEKIGIDFFNQSY